MVNGAHQAAMSCSCRKCLLRRLHSAEVENCRLFQMLAKIVHANGAHAVLSRLAFHCEQRSQVLHGYVQGSARQWPLARLFSEVFLRLLFPALALRIMERRLQKLESSYGLLEKNAPFFQGAVKSVNADTVALAMLSDSSGKGCAMSAVVLGLNDALVEMTGALAGFTMSLQSNRLIMLAGFTTGIAATLSMAASEFFAQKAASDGGEPRRAAAYTGIAYLVTVLLLLLPFMILPKPLLALGVCMFIACVIIFVFTWVDSLLRRASFWKNFFQMLGISFGVALAIFLLSWAVRIWLGVDI